MTPRNLIIASTFIGLALTALLAPAVASAQTPPGVRGERCKEAAPIHRRLVESYDRQDRIHRQWLRTASALNREIVRPTLNEALIVQLARRGVVNFRDAAQHRGAIASATAKDAFGLILCGRLLDDVKRRFNALDRRFRGAHDQWNKTLSRISKRTGVPMTRTPAAKKR